MCGRINVTDNPLVQWMFDRIGIPFTTKTNTNLCPTQNVATLAYLDGSLRHLNTIWGIKGEWSKKLLINAQGETVATNKKTFKNAFIHNRCLVPCTGWYEWRDEGGPRKQKYSFTRVDGDPFLMAGIWYEAEDLPQVVTLTINPSPRCSEIHNRMPLLIMPENIDPWFHSTPEDIQPLLKPANDEVIRIERCG